MRQKKKKKVESGAGSSRCRLSIALCDVRRNRDRTGAELELESQLLSCRLAKCWGGYECDSLWLDGNDIGRRVDTWSNKRQSRTPNRSIVTAYVAKAKAKDR